MPFFYVSGEVEGGIICPICATAMAYVHHLLSDRRFQVIEFLRFDRVKSGNFEHQVNSDIHFQTVEIQMRRLLMSRLIRIFTVCLHSLFLF